VQGAFSSRPIPAANIGLDHGLLLSLRRQLKAMPGAPSCLLGSLLLVLLSMVRGLLVLHCRPHSGRWPRPERSTATPVGRSA